MEENSSTRGFNYALAIIATLVIALIIFGGVTVAQNLANTKTNDLTTVANQMDESTYTSLEGQDITGIEVQSKEKSTSNGNIYVVIERTSSSKIVMYYDEDITKPIDSAKNKEIAAGLSNKKSAYYVNPNAMFNVSIIYDDDGVLVGVKFTQNA